MTTSPGILDDGRSKPGAPPAGGRRRRMPLAGLPQPVSRARAFTTRTLEDWCWPAADPWTTGHGVDDIVLVVAELVANAKLHAGGPLELVLDVSDTRLRIEVSDPAPEPPAPRRPHLPSVPGGHGLFIVQRTSDRWGHERHAQGKSVWAEFDIDGRAGLE
ncbi:ATP-binding protein [Streptomyces bambusae]|uniref:ATP-binding protein n=1 Tax=Streptomyces bambusae TaxID=1550616 RepID=UPI001CFCB582|nr:ATP-binding protein [Streptomyces bambusae]MCB5164460.1 ATP-binding protein [Streptomyces bambusae]